MKKTYYYLLSTFLLFISSMQVVNASFIEENHDEQIIRAVSVLTPSIHDEALKHTQRIYANQPQKLETILSLLGELKGFEFYIQPLVLMHVASMDNVSDMGNVVDSWGQINGIENKLLREMAIDFMENAGSLGDINNIGNAFYTLYEIENPSVQQEALNRMLGTRSTKKMDKIAEQAKAYEQIIRMVSVLSNSHFMIHPIRL